MSRLARGWGASPLAQFSVGKSLSGRLDFGQQLFCVACGHLSVPLGATAWVCLAHVCLAFLFPLGPTLRPVVCVRLPPSSLNGACALPGLWALARALVCRDTATRSTTSLVGEQ